MAQREITKPKKMPDLKNWAPAYNEIFYIYDEEVVSANYDKHVGLLEEKCSLPIFYIKKTHYKKKMADIVHHMNYFTKFYDLDRDTYFSIMTVKYQIDTHLDMDESTFLRLLMDRIVTPSFVAKCKHMADDLYSININTDDEGKYKNTPKITNVQAKQIVALSFCFRIILPLCIHFSNVSTASSQTTVKTQYLDGLSDIFLKIIKRFEKDDVEFFTSLCRFVWFRVVRLYKNNLTTFEQKKMLRGDTPELFCEKLIKEVISVKTIYKLDYHRSCVSFIDGVIHNYEGNYLIENYASKPYEIDSADTSRDSDDSLSHAEALEMASYNRDASSIMVSECNRKTVLKSINDWYGAFNVSDEELEFYVNNCRLNDINLFLLNSFYSDKFKDSYTILSLNRQETIKLLIYMKKYLQYHKMPILAQILTSTISGKYKTNMIKNSKFLERIFTSNVYTSIIANKFQYIAELDQKENPIIKYLSMIINCVFEFVDFDEKINGYLLEDIAIDETASEFLLFLSII